MTYKLVTEVKGKKITLTYHNFYVATDKLFSIGNGKLYQGKLLVGEL
jgi:hypothetical protein